MTRIAWCERTWNPVKGCTPISAGCQRCYAKRMATRLAHMGSIGYEFPSPFKVTFQKHVLDQPRRWRKPSLIFVCSMGDLFHDDVTIYQLDRIWEVMLDCPQHTFLILTKRPERMCDYMEGADRCSSVGQVWIPNVWLGVTVENNSVSNRLTWLRQLPVARTLVSYEPALEQVDWTPYLPDIGWLICGGESGPGARPFDDAWGIQARDQCKAAGVPFFWKQRGPKDGKFETWPEEFQVREYPEFSNPTPAPAATVRKAMESAIENANERMSHPDSLGASDPSSKADAAIQKLRQDRRLTREELDTPTMGPAPADEGSGGT